MNPVIEFKNFTFKYRSQVEPSLTDINFAVYPGEKILITGESGSGKSTLAYCINGLIPFAFKGDITGSCTVMGQSTLEQGIFGLSKHVGTVLQDTDSQFIGLTVAEDIAFSLENDCVPQEQMFDRVNETAAVVELQKLLANTPGRLSGGQKQRVSMAGVMVDDVEILLFDEPLANLDPRTGKRAMELIDEIQKQRHATVIIIEHRVEDVLCRHVDRIVVMDNGRIAADASPDEVLAQSVLVKAGLREPLYITAIKHAGCAVSADSKPGSIETMDLSSCRDAVRAWFQSVEVPVRQKSSESVLRVENLSFSYKSGVRVLHDISFDVKKGEIVSLVGKNGAGKSTLASLVCGFNKPEAGRILFGGENIAPLSIKERGTKIGLVMQNPNQMISKPMIYDEVALGLRVRGVDEASVKEKVHAVLKTCGLYPFRNWPVSALSFGQKKRVTIAAILALDPEVLILDEPTAGQDYTHYTDIMEFIRKLNRESGVTIIMITHDMHLMLEYTDRSIVIADGELIADTEPWNVLTDDAVAEKAYLKRTSLYDLAVRCGIGDGSGFAARFIAYERQVKDNG